MTRLVLTTMPARDSQAPSEGVSSREPALRVPPDILEPEQSPVPRLLLLRGALYHSRLDESFVLCLAEPQ